MTNSEMFDGLLGNLVIRDRPQISDRYERITSALNKKFRDTDSATANSIQVGSYGRKTGIAGLSDLDMIYILPKGEWDRLKDHPRKALEETRNAIVGTYHSTKVRVDRLVVVVQFENYKIEVQPCFEQDDRSFKYPDTKRGEWLVTMPREEIDEIGQKDEATKGNLRDLCKIARAWRNHHGLKMGGLLVDTLAYQFISSTSDYDKTGTSSHPNMFRDFLKHLSDEPEDKKRYHALGSGQWVHIKKAFQRRAKRALALAEDAIASYGQAGCCKKWRKLFTLPPKEQM